jgi:hypothetical protein
MTSPPDAEPLKSQLPSAYVMDRAWPRRWQAHWTGAEPPAAVADGGPNLHATMGGRFARHLYRRRSASIRLEQLDSALS